MDDVFVSNLNQLLAAHGMSQACLATRLGMSRNAVSVWCRGSSEPHLSDLSRIAAVFGLTAADLLTPEIAAKKRGAVISVPLVSSDAPYSTVGSVSIPVAYGTCPDRYAVQISGRCIAVCVPLDWTDDDASTYGYVLTERAGVDGSHRYELGWGHRADDGNYDLVSLFDHSPLTESDRLVARVELTIGSLDGLSL